MENFANQGEK